MSKATKVFWTFLALLYSGASLSYGSSSGGGKSCTEPQFSEESPKDQSSVSSLSQFTVEASKNTDLSTLVILVDGTPIKPNIKTLLNGDSKLELQLTEPKTLPSKVQITLRAKSDEGCEGFKPYYIFIKP